MRYMITLSTLIVGMLAGCGATMTAPEDFVEVPREQRGAYDFRAISADGAVVAVRRIDNAKKGTLDFWTQAVSNELKVGKGYKLTESKDVRSSSGAPGRLLTLTSRQGGVDYIYMLALYVRPDAVIVAEAAGTTDAIEPKRSAITEALLSAR